MTIQHLARPDGHTIAFRRIEGEGPTMVWIGGYRSDMNGTKARHLEALARERGWSYLAFDHFAHGASSGDFAEATIGRWREDALAVIDEASAGPLVLVGSSMGGWVSLLAALARPERLHGLVLIAPAPDFAHDLMWPSLSDETRQAIMRDGAVPVSDPDGLGDYVLTHLFFDEARNWTLMDRPLPLACRVHILHGRHDESVPLAHAERLRDLIEAPVVRFTLIEDGDHRLSRDQDLARLSAIVGEMRP